MIRRQFCNRLQSKYRNKKGKITKMIGIIYVEKKEFVSSAVCKNF